MEKGSNRAQAREFVRLYEESPNRQRLEVTIGDLIWFKDRGLELTRMVLDFYHDDVGETDSPMHQLARKIAENAGSDMPA